MLKCGSGRELGVGGCRVGAQMWEFLAVLSTEEETLTSLGEAWQAYADIWILQAVSPRESVPSAELHRTDTCIARRSRGAVA